MITKTTIQRGFIESKKGWCFSVYFDDRPYPNLISALYKTKKETKQQLERYINTGEYNWYGSAE